MVRPRTSPETTPILQLLSDYSFDVDTYTAEAMVTGWLQRFEPAWVSQAITEALYQGRYKMVSVDHILQIWQRRGQPLRHFNREFESIILGQSWGQFLAATKANAASLDADLPSSAAPTREADAQPPISAATAGENGYPVTPSLSEAFLSAQGSTHGSPAWFTPDLSAPGLSQTESLPLDPPGDSPALFGGSSRTILPLTPDQLARLTQPAGVPEAANPAMAELQSHPPIDDLDHLTDDTQLAEAGTPAEGRKAETKAETKAEQMSEALPALETATIAESIANPMTTEEPAPEETATEPPATETAATEATTTESLDSATWESATWESEPVPMLQPTSEPRGETNATQVGIPNFQPVAALASRPESADSIPPFVPNPGPSDLHQRLKAVVEAGRQDD